MRAPAPLVLPLLLLLAPACGPAEGKGLALKEGASLGDAGYCFADGSCLSTEQLWVCVEVKYDDYDSPPLCLPANVCERFTCAEGECRVYTGVPGQVKCVIP